MAVRFQIVQKVFQTRQVPLLVARLQFQGKAKNTKMKLLIIRWLMLNLPSPVPITILSSRG